ncbi:MAG: hypothetical protein QM496_11665 [Verrucomicrobiota bacterium]
MIDTLYIHAGSHKTGSSSIQSFLRLNRKELLGQNILVSNIKGMIGGGVDQSSIGVNFQAFKRLSKLKAERVIISREMLFWVNDIDSLIGLKDALQRVAREVRIIFYLRRQDYLAVSHKQEGAKHVEKRSKTLRAYGNTVTALPETLTPLAAGFLDYETRLSMWAEVFGVERMVVRVFENERLKGGDVVEDFCDIFDFNPHDYRLAGKKNESFTRTSQLFLHQSGEQFNSCEAEKKLLVKAVRRVDEKLKDREKLLPSRKQAMDFYQQFKEGNIRLNEFLKISPTEAIFNDDFSQYPEIANEQRLTEQQLHQMYAKVFSHLSLKKQAKTRVRDIRLSRRIRDVSLTLPVEYRQQTVELLKIARKLNSKDPTIRKKLQELNSSENST